MGLKADAMLEMLGDAALDNALFASRMPPDPDFSVGIFPAPSENNPGFFGIYSSGDLTGILSQRLGPAVTPLAPASTVNAFTAAATPVRPITDPSPISTPKFGNV